MKIADADILFVGEKENDENDHWQNRWAAKFSTAKYLINESGTDAPKVCIEKCTQAIKHATKPVVIVAHCLGCLWVLKALEENKKKIVGAFFVAPSISSPEFDYPKTTLPFPCCVLASEDDPLCPKKHANILAQNWGAYFVGGGENKHFNSQSGHGPWPEGLMVFAELMKKI